jgi:flagellar biosynthesis/type III secretory pathway protein FliH
MSSFRPDFEGTSPGFVALSFTGAPTAVVNPLAGEFVVEPATQVDLPAVAAVMDPEFGGFSEEEVAVREQVAFDRGVETARAEIDRWQPVCEAVELAAHRWEFAARASIGANRELVLDLCVEIARRWVGAELRLDASLFGGVLDRAVEALGEGEAGQLFLHPSDFEILSVELSDQIANWQERGVLSVQTDPNVEPGDFRLVNARSSIDGREGAIVEGLRTALDAALDAQAPEGNS